MLAVATLLGSVGLTVLEPTSQAHADPACMTNGGVYVVFVRGSGESFDGPQATAFRNDILGAINQPPRLPVATAWAEIGNLDGSPGPNNNANDPGEYPAVGWADWGIFTGMDGYYNSVWTGVNELIKHLNDRASRCPKESIVVGGYSQGAEVVGYAMTSVSDYTLSHIGFVALYGDPRATACSSGNNVNVPWRRGSANCALGSLGTRTPYMPSSLYGRVGSWCDSSDGVCTGNLAYLPVAGNPLSSHGSAYQDRWILDSSNEIANKALDKLNQLNPGSPQVSLPSYVITLPDTSSDSPAAPPPPPTIHQVKRSLAPDGTTHEVYAATDSTVTEGWWHPGGDGVHTDEVIHIAQNNIIGFDKVNEPDGVTQSLYTAVPDGVWETWWRPGDGPHSSKIVSGLSGVRQVIAAPTTINGQYTHRLYLLASDGPYEVWWRDGGDGIHVSLLNNISGAVTMTKSTGPSGEDQLYVATPTWVYELWWYPGQGVHYSAIINITQGDIRSLSKGANLPDGGQLLYTGTSTTAWQSYWNTGTSVSNGTIATGQSNAIQIEKDVYNGVHELYLATSDHVQEYWWNGPNSGSDTLITISQNNITSFDKSDDGGYQQVYTASGNLVYETYWAAGVGPTSDVLFTVQR